MLFVLLAPLAAAAQPAPARKALPDTHKPMPEARRASTAGSAALEAQSGGLAGIVRGETLEPVSSAHVYAYSLADFEVRKVLTDVAGKFRFSSLPAGLYNIVAFKAGFAPVVVALTRPSAERAQALDLHLVPQEVGTDASPASDYWQVRNRVPPDVLREIETLEILQAAVPLGFTVEPGLGQFSTGFEASAGVDAIAGVGDAQVAGGRVDVQGRLRHLGFGVAGNYTQLESTSDPTGEAGGSSQYLAVNLTGENDGTFQLITANNRLVTRDQEGPLPVDLEHLRVSYSGPMGEGGQSVLAAQVVEESNFYRRGLINLTNLPTASRTWQVEGSYSRDIGDRSHVEGGMRYRERQLDYVRLPTTDERYPGERVDLFGKAGHRIRPALLIEYGVYSVLRDGELALAPQGGVVLQLSSHWQAGAQVSGRLTDSVDSRLAYRDFLPMRYNASRSACEQGEELCYRLDMVREAGDDRLSLSAVHREFGETLRLYFSDDFFDHQESVYLVPGDRLPELQFGVTRRLSPTILTHLASTVASGGGGVFYAMGQDPYENQVRYFITSVDTHFGSTSTGVFVALHQLEQSLTPLMPGSAPVEAVTSQRLQLKVSQDLDVLLDLPADWALHLNMELARGNFAEADKDTRSRVLGGIAVKF